MTADTPASVLSRMKSPLLRGFETNPFRILRLPVTAPTSAAALQAETALTLARVGMSPEEPDALPWLANAGEYELQQAAQAVEEPLIRLKYQLLWFDFERDPKAGVLRAAVADPAGDAMRTYLAAELNLRDDGDGDEVVAHCVNQANARLLSAAALANGVFASEMAETTGTAFPESKWKTLGSFRELPMAHVTVNGNGANGTPDSAVWAGALQRWSSLLAAPRFRAYLISCIERLEDDFVSSEDAEAVEESVRAFLADLAAQEARFFVLEGSYPAAGSVINAIARSGMELRVVAPAMRPLRQIFQSEIVELEPLLESPEVNVEAIEACILRLQAIRRRWTDIDSGGVVGLREMLDEAVEKAYLRLRNVVKADRNVDTLLGKVVEIASAESLKERVRGYEKELEESRTRLCYFCKTGTPDYEKSVVLRGKKETGRTHSFNTTTIHYQLRYAIVLRCARCAKVHQFIRSVGFALWASAVPLGILAVIIALAVTSN